MPTSTPSRALLQAGLCAVVTLGCGADSGTETIEDRSWLNAPATYEVQALAGVPGSAAKAVNDHGQVVINTTDGTTSHALLWERGEITNLGSLGGSDTYVWGINESGMVVGESQNAQGDHLPVRLERRRHDRADRTWAGKSVDGCGVRGQRRRSSRRRVVRNRRNRICDSFRLGSGHVHGASPPRGADWTNSAAWDINAAGEISGAVIGPAGSAAVRWHGNEATVLSISEHALSEAALAIDGQGNAFGRTTDADLRCRAKVWRKNATEYLPFEAAVAVAANEAGFVAGQLLSTTGKRGAFVVTPTRAIDLQTATPNNPYATTLASDVDRRGRVVGAGFFHGDDWQDAEAVMWTPTGDTIPAE